MTKAKKLVAGILGAAALVAVPAVAVAQGSPWYAGVHVGQSDADLLGEKDTAFRILGGYQLNRTFAAELAYTDFGKATFGPYTLKANTIELVGVGTVPLENKFSVYGKLGLFRGEGKLTGGGFNEKDDSIELTFGVGLRYDVTPAVGVRAEWQSYLDVGDGVSDVDLLSVGVVFKF